MATAEVDYVFTTVTKPVTIVEDRVILTLTRREAGLLHHIAFRFITGPFEGSRGLTSAIADALEKVGVESNPSDFPVEDADVRIHFTTSFNEN